MTGPEHYRKAERLLQEASKARGMSYGRDLLAEAQVHATLALVDARDEPIEPEPGEPVMHASMYRDGIPGTLCRPGWEPMVTTITDKVTCPVCRQRIDGGPIRAVRS